MPHTEPYDETPLAGRLRVNVTEGLTLDAGRWETRITPDGHRKRCIQPPATSMFEQLIDFLRQHPTVERAPGLNCKKEGVAATALCLRWGSYLAVLADRSKPLWRPPTEHHQKISRICDAEMARINIEASAALAAWIELMRQDYDQYLKLVASAIEYLPMTLRTTTCAHDAENLLALTIPRIAARLESSCEASMLMQVRQQTRQYPTRVLANGLINFCWRNGPIETIHEGRASVFPLHYRRIRPSEERHLMRTTAGRLAQGFVLWMH